MYPTFPEVMIVCCAAGSLLLYITKKFRYYGCIS